MGDWRPVQSSNLNRVRYFRPARLLVIEFKDRYTGLPSSIYLYSKVPWSVYMGLIRAKSKGGYHARKIRDRYDYQPVPMREAVRVGLFK